MQGQLFDFDSIDANPTLRVVIAYNDLTTGKRAMRLMAELGKAFGNAIEFEPLPWSFDLLADTNWRQVAANHAVNADILIIANGDSNPLPPVIGRWAENAIRRKQGTHAAVVALFGPEENPDGAGSSRLQAIQGSAQRAGLDFFSPAPHLGLNEPLARIPRQAEMIAPAFHDHFQHHLPASRWGINE